MWAWAVHLAVSTTSSLQTNNLAAAFFVSYEWLKRHTPFNNASLNHMSAASGAEFISCLIRVPTEVVKSRTQTGIYGEGKSSLHSVMMTAKENGLRGFYRGFGITIAREVGYKYGLD